MSDTPSTFAPKTPLQEFWFYFKQNRGALIGLIFILLVALISILAPYIAPLIQQSKIVPHFTASRLV